MTGRAWDQRERTRPLAAPADRGETGAQSATASHRPEGGGGVSPSDLDAVRRQLGRAPRGVHGVAHRCPCGLPDVVRTEPRLPDGTPFPTSYYATCPRLTGAVSTLEGTGLMRAMQQRLGRDPDLATAYRRAHEDYLARRAQLGTVPEIEGVSAGGMPVRVKCLHVLAAHALAVGPGVNPLGDEVIEALAPWWLPTSCADQPDSQEGDNKQRDHKQRDTEADTQPAPDGAGRG